MHVAFALMLGAADGAHGPAARGSRRSGWLYPLLVTFVVVATANHWWFDAFTGALVGRRRGASRRSLFARWRPAAWAWTAGPPAAAAQQAV